MLPLLCSAALDKARDPSPPPKLPVVAVKPEPTHLTMIPNATRPSGPPPGYPSGFNNPAPGPMHGDHYKWSFTALAPTRASVWAMANPSGNTTSVHLALPTAN